jgi:hypothetical protein
LTGTASGWNRAVSGCGGGSPARGEVTALAFGALAKRLAVPDELAARVADGQCDPVEAAEELLSSAVIFKDLSERVRASPPSDQATSS